MKPPLNSLPLRAWVMEMRNDYLIISSTDNRWKDEYKANNLGFSIQLQNRFKVSEKIWLHLTPSMELDYDGSENIGGCYVGVI